MDSPDNSADDSASSSNLSLKLKYPIFKVKHPCDGIPYERKKKQKAPTEIESEDVQSISSHDIPWLSRNRHFCKISFDEKLIVCRKLDKMVGEAVINVYLTEQYDFLLHCDWKLFDTECFGESSEVPDCISFTGLIRRNLVTLEEKYSELDLKKGRENHVYIWEKLDSYHVSRTLEDISQENTKSEETFKYCFDKFKDILTQGSLILLLRQITIMNILQIDPLHILMPDGKLYDVTFQLSDFQWAVFDKELKILVKQTVAEITHPETGELVERITSLLTENGRIVYQDWTRKELVLRFDPRKDIKSYYCSSHPVAKPPSKLPMEEVWRQDMQLNSLYMQRNRILQQDFQSYYERRPQLKSILRDYLKDVLMVKPKCPLTYTVQYFSNLF